MSPAVAIDCVSTGLLLFAFIALWAMTRRIVALQESHHRLHKEFWRQSLMQADHNCEIWIAHRDNVERVRFILNHLSLSVPPDKPPDQPLN